MSSKCSPPATRGSCLCAVRSSHAMSTTDCDTMILRRGLGVLVVKRRLLSCEAAASAPMRSIAQGFVLPRPCIAAAGQGQNMYCDGLDTLGNRATAQEVLQPRLFGPGGGWRVLPGGWLPVEAHRRRPGAAPCRRRR
eukprot:COSAG06_NODE_74_length_25881_cov_16.549569_3_plen_137_part_00